MIMLLKGQGQKVGCDCQSSMVNFSASFHRFDGGDT